MIDRILAALLFVVGVPLAVVFGVAAWIVEGVAFVLFAVSAYADKLANREGDDE